MKLARWLLALHLVAIAVAIAVAIPAECDGTRLKALCASSLVAGAVTALVCTVALLRSSFRGRLLPKDDLVLIILCIIGADEGWQAFSGLSYLIGLPG